MNNDSITITVKEFHFNVLPMRTRFPFRYGIASMTTLPHLFVRVAGEVNGVMAEGLAAEGLPPKWFTKDPETTFEEDLPEMLEVIRHAAEAATTVEQGETVFDWWREVCGVQTSWAEARGVPPLLANLGISLVERAVLDAVCRACSLPIGELVRRNLPGIRLGEVYPELESAEPASLLPPVSLSRIDVRHTVGLGDALTEGEVDPGIDDGLPVSLEAVLRAYGLRYFKIKLSGEFERDAERLVRVARVLADGCGESGYWFTIDGNEQFPDIACFAAQWERHLAEHRLKAFWPRLLFVEQPLHRAHALDDAVGAALREWKAAPPMIIDESEADMGCLPRALALGYAGTSHKNCKGVIKGIANAALLEHRRRERPGETRFILSGEDLANVGPVALPQDLAVMAMLGVRHVERNGHHYFRGLQHLPADLQEHLLQRHGDLYMRHPAGFTAVSIRDGALEIGSVTNTMFGVGPLIDADRFTPLNEWESGLDS